MDSQHPSPDAIVGGLLENTPSDEIERACKTIGDALEGGGYTNSARVIACMIVCGQVFGRAPHVVHSQLLPVMQKLAEATSFSVIADIRGVDPADEMSLRTLDMELRDLPNSAE